MNKRDVNVNYPKRRIKAKDIPVIGIQEPKRRSMYDILCENFRLANRVTFLHRIIYIGIHTFPMSEIDDIISLFSSTVNTSSVETEDKPTGFLVIYPKYFIHIIEGDEDIIHVHLNLLFNHKHIEMLKDIKFLVFLSNINRRLINEWGYFCGIPKQQCENIEHSQDEHFRLVTSCIIKLYSLIDSIVTDYEELASTGKSLSGSITGLLSAADVRRETGITAEFKNTIPDTSDDKFIQKLTIGAGCFALANDDVYKDSLPRNTLLDTIINSKLTMDLLQYFRICRHVPQRNIYEDNVWPVPLSFTPYDIFETSYDAVTKLPKSETDNKISQDGFDESKLEYTENINMEKLNIQDTVA